MLEKATGVREKMTGSDALRWKTTAQARFVQLQRLENLGRIREGPQEGWIDAV